MSNERRKRLKGAAIIFAFYALAFGLPSAWLNGTLLDILVLSVVFGVPTCLLAGVFDPHLWGLKHGRTKEHPRLY